VLSQYPGSEGINYEESIFLIWQHVHKFFSLEQISSTSCPIYISFKHRSMTYLNMYMFPAEPHGPIVCMSTDVNAGLFEAHVNARYAVAQLGSYPSPQDVPTMTLELKRKIIVVEFHPEVDSLIETIHASRHARSETPGRRMSSRQSTTRARAATLHRFPLRPISLTLHAMRNKRPRSLSRRPAT